MLKSLGTQIKKRQVDRFGSFVFFLLLYALIIFALSGMSNQKLVNLHLVLDTSNAILSLLLALFLLAEQSNVRHNVRNYLVIAFGFAAGTELLHALVGIEWEGEFAWIQRYVHLLRPATWPPSTYVLPLALLWATWLMRRGKVVRPLVFGAGMAAATIVLYLLSFNLPAYIDTGVLGIQRPTQLPLLLLLLILVIVCWRERGRSPLFEGLLWMGIFLFLSDAFMLFSTSPHEKFALIAHAGKFVAYVFLHVIQMRMTVEDSRARSLAESALQHEERSLRKALEELAFQQFALDQHSIVGVTDVQGTITYVNDSFCKISGYTREELLGKNHRLINSGEHSKEFFREMYRTIASGQVWNGEICNRAKDGQLYWVKTTVVPLMGDDGKPAQYFSMRTDISERKRVETELIRYQDHLEELVAEQIMDLKRAKETAEAASLAKSNFLANMSHEIRTPMNGVVGIVDILQESNLTPEQLRMVNTIRNSSLALLGILGDILDFSKIEAGKLEVELIPVNLRELVEGVAQLLAPTVADKDMDLIVFVHPDLPAWVLTDPGRLRQILFNLLGNAVKFTQSNLRARGHVVLRVEKRVSAGGQDVLHFSISDNGIGMTAETVAQLFKPFAQADATTTRRFGGTGLGLSISKHLAGLLHGQIDVISTYGSGTEFCVGLPLQLAPPAHSQIALPGLSGMNILIVTGHPEYAEILPAYLHAVGAKVETVATREQALESIRQSAANNWEVLLDLTADISGDSELSQEIKKVAPALPVVRLVSRRISAPSTHEFVVAANPLLFDELVSTLAIASRRHAIKDVVQTSERRSMPRKIVPSVEEAAGRNELILVAEDNEVSREVVQEQLRILGYASESAEDGYAALDKWRTGRYALLLTDCHMPYLDGFGLTAAIRNEEPADRRFRIIAVTGNAMQGEAQRCLAQGMDDYLAKPLRLSDLGAKLARWLPHQQAQMEDVPAPAAAAAAAGAAESFTADAVWDASTLTRMVGDYPDMHRRLLDKFVSSTEAHVAAILTAAAAGDLDTLAGVAHKMKSAARTVGAIRLGTLCQELETSAKTADAQTAQTCSAQIEAAFMEAVTRIKNSLA